MATLTGKTLGKYRVTERLGRGGMADVYKAYHPSLDRYVAIKVLHDFLSEGEDFLARFGREARAVAALRHPQIVQVYDFDAEGELFYMVMEFVDGGTLKAKLQELSVLGQRLPLSEVARIVRQLAEALDHAHGQGMLHRDVKPSNVLLDSSGRVFLTDFGVARILGDTQFTASGALIGTPAYMSPEQGRGLPLTAATDIYSLGVVLYELVAGQAPFDADTPLAVIYKHIHDPLPLPGVLRPDVPEALERVILKAMAKDPEDRYQSASQMILAIDRAMALGPEAETVPEVLDWDDASDIGLQVTGVLEAEPLSKVVAPDVAGAAAVVEEMSVPRPGVARPAAAPQSRRWFGSLAVFVLLGTVLVVGLILFLLLPQLFGAEGCSTVEECQTEAAGLMEEDDYEGAVEWYDRALALVADEERRDYAYLWCDRGDLNKDLGQFDEAISDSARCVDWTEGDTEYEWLRARAAILQYSTQATELEDEGDLEGALEQLGWALDQVPEGEHPNYAYLWCRKGNLKSWMGYDEEAIPYFEMCAEWTEGAAGFEWTRTWAGILEYSTRATVLEYGGDLEGALEQLDWALDLVPEDEQPGYAYLMCHRGELNSWAGQFEEATSDFEWCIQWAEGTPEFEETRTWAEILQYSAQATGLVEDGDLEGAAEQYDLALNLVPDEEHPNYAYLWCDKGDLTIWMEQIDEAIANFEQCSEWTEGEADFDEIRSWADEALMELREE